MKAFILAIALVVLSGTAGAQTWVQGHFRADGTYVAPHFRSNPDGRTWNNWSVAPNINPYTGQQGTRTIPRSQTYLGLPGQHQGLGLNYQRRQGVWWRQ